MEMPLETVLLVIIAGTAVVTDIRSHRISNALCLFGIGAGFALHLSGAGFATALVQGMGGLLIGAAFLLPLYLLGGMAAGDIKLMAAIGCIVGVPSAVVAALYSLTSGALLGLAYMVLRGGLPEIRERYWQAFSVFIRTFRFALAPPKPGAVSQSRFPYAVAIAVGSLLAVT